MGPVFTVRPARPDDREPVLAFCRDIWGPGSGDYLEETWEPWLRSDTGRLVVADAGDQPIGVCFVRLVSGWEAYLQGMRVHPDHRRRGVATELARYCLDYAVGQGRHVVRLATAEENLAARRAAEGLGFRWVVTFGVWRAPAESFGAPATFATAQDIPAIFRLFRRSDAPRLFAPGWIWKTLTWDMVEEAVRAGQVLVRPEGFALLHWRPERLWLTWLEGTEGACGGLARSVRSIALKEGHEEAFALLPTDPPIEACLLDAGFTRIHTYLIYEHRLTGEPARDSTGGNRSGGFL
ncbi:MAG: GNAT family N-acetyltransferase [candidate division NC10 bacterium]|nr:GNAT family N-acetyltransferase [candidate division NC10 bacterium]